MHVLGFNSTHDASAALLHDGRVLAAIEEERLSRQKHHAGFPELALNAVLAHATVAPSDVDHAAFYWNPWRGLIPFGLHFLKNLPASWHYARVQPGIWGDFVRMPKTLRRRLGFRGDFHFVDHHRAHAYSTFCPSPFEEAGILSVDGTGEWTTTYLARGDANGIRPLHEVRYPHSIGKVYEAVTQYLGFRPVCDEGKVMGLAAYGDDRYVDDFRDIVRIDSRGGLRVDTSCFQYQIGAPDKFSPRFEERFGPRRRSDEPLDDRHRAIAFALQERTEEVVLALARALHEMCPVDALCMVGGVALNCVANGRVLRDGPFERIYVQPSAGDAGAALGAALAVHHKVTGEMPRDCMADAYLGPGFDEASCEAALRDAGLPYERPDDIASACADEIASRRIVGWFQGRMEYGPRALGNRSILADPRDPGMRDYLNFRVKHREEFRPFAPAILAEHVHEYFEDASESPYMLLSFQARDEKLGVIPSVVHIDGSARVQTVDERNPILRRLIESFHAKTGVPVVLNTSFNRRGEPIVCTPADAVKSFLAEEMDRLALGPFLARRPEEAPDAKAARDRAEEPAGAIAGGRA